MFLTVGAWATPVGARVANTHDGGNIAYKKPARSNLSKPQAQNVTDGDPSTFWSGIFFPAYVDVDLMDTYGIDTVVLHFPEGKASYYTIYGSNDGRNYDRIYRTREAKPATAAGDTITFDEPKAYRILRVNVEFTDADNKAELSEIEVFGKKSAGKKNTAELRGGTLEDILDIKAFDKTPYAKPIENDEIIENVYGIIDRTVGAEYRDWFVFELADGGTANDYFELSDLAAGDGKAAGKILIKGNEGLSLATGLNYYFKNYANVHISEQTMQAAMPASVVPIGGTVRKETPYKVRYAFNYCTLNYTFSFFGEEQWQRENDWLALNGVNVVLDLAGQEAAWIKFLMNFGYSFDDAKDWLTGPAYYAWQFMDNMESFGGPVPDRYVKDRLELARKTQRWKRSLGMQTVLQGYAGMIPTNFTEYQPEVSIVKQGNWNGFARPYMIATDSPLYDDYAKKFYAAQEFVYGRTSDYYAVDPFHEGGIRPEGLTDDVIAAEVLESLLGYDKDAVWIVQGWQSNPTNSLLKGMGENRNGHVLIVDLIKYPLKSWTKYNKLKYDRTTLDSLEFNGTNWAWCLLGNFGGNPSMHGQMDVMVEDILTARKTSKHMQGIGIISEATYENPVLYDLIFDLAWADEGFDLGQWLDKYIERRYGATSANARQAWDIMRRANYNHGVRFTNELFGMKSKGPHNYGSQDIPYGAEKLEQAFKLLAADFDLFKGSESYLYDLTEIMRQVVSNYAVLTYNDLLKAKADGSLAAFRDAKSRFLKAFDVLNAVQATQKEQLGGEWIGKAADIARDYDDFARDMFKVNAKTLITTWGSRGGGSLKDYGWRNYEGIFTDVYKAVWSKYLDRVEQGLVTALPVSGGAPYFNFYWDWIMGDQDYTRVAKDSPQELRQVVNMVVENCSLQTAADYNTGNLALGRKVSVVAGKATGDAAMAADGLLDTQLSLSVDGSVPAGAENGADTGGMGARPQISVDLIGQFQISEVNVVCGDTGFSYEVYVSSDGRDWEKIDRTDHEQSRLRGDDVFNADNRTVRFVKVVGGDTSKVTDDSIDGLSIGGDGIAVKEIRVYGERVLPTLGQLDALVEAAVSAERSTREMSKEKAESAKRVGVSAKVAREALKNSAPPDEVNTVYWDLYDAIIALD